MRRRALVFSKLINVHGGWRQLTIVTITLVHCCSFVASRANYPSLDHLYPGKYGWAEVTGRVFAIYEGHTSALNTFHRDVLDDYSALIATFSLTTDYTGDERTREIRLRNGTRRFI